MKSFTNPPKIVESVMGAILLLLTGTLPKDSWKASKILLGSADFLQKILHFDKENVSEKVY